MDFSDLMLHVDHQIEVITYGLHGKPPWRNAAIECLDCDYVLHDIDNPDYLTVAP